MRKYFLFLFFIFFNFAVFAEERVEIYPNSAGKFSFVLPNGYCNITTNTTGKITIRHLEKLLKDQPTIPKVIYRPCNSLAEPYPWGYTAIHNQKLPNSVTAKEFFELISEFLEDSEIVTSIKNDINQAHRQSETEIEVGSIGTTKILWKDENALVFFMTSNGTYKEKNINEVVTTAVTLHDQLPVYSHIYEIKGKENPLINAQLFLESAKATNK